MRPLAPVFDHYKPAFFTHESDQHNSLTNLSATCQWEDPFHTAIQCLRLIVPTKNQVIPMNPDKNTTNKKATSAPVALPQDPQTKTTAPPEVSYCHNCRKNTRSDLSVPYCDRNTLGTASVTAEQHGNIIGGMATCDGDYCDPQESSLEEFYELAGKDAVPQEVFSRCQVCQHLKQPEIEERKGLANSRPNRKKRRSR